MTMNGPFQTVAKPHDRPRQVLIGHSQLVSQHRDYRETTEKYRHEVTEI